MTVHKRTLRFQPVGRAQKIEGPASCLERKGGADNFNWYAFCLSIILELPPDKAMTKMGILPYKKGEKHKPVIKRH